jgi:hypothetical protein
MLVMDNEKICRYGNVKVILNDQTKILAKAGGKTLTSCFQKKFVPLGIYLYT